MSSGDLVFFSELKLQVVHGSCVVEEPRRENKSLGSEYHAGSENYWITDVKKILEILQRRKYRPAQSAYIASLLLPSLTFLRGSQRSSLRTSEKKMPSTAFHVPEASNPCSSLCVFNLHIPVVVGETLTWGVSLIKYMASRSQLALCLIPSMRYKKLVSVMKTIKWEKGNFSLILVQENTQETWLFSETWSRGNPGPYSTFSLQGKGLEICFFERQRSAKFSLSSWTKIYYRSYITVRKLRHMENNLFNVKRANLRQGKISQLLNFKCSFTKYSLKFILFSCSKGYKLKQLYHHIF